MTAGFRLPQYRTGDDDLDVQVASLVQATDGHDLDLVFEILAAGVRLARSHADRLDLKITSAALKEMRAAYDMFADHRHVPKVTIFGSARTLPEAPLYSLTRELAVVVAQAGWMVVTGAGPGIMQAGMEGAGTERSVGVSIRLPFESEANPLIAGDDKHVSMKYFFTRKLMLMKESAAFVALPGGFGTLDETLELLTLQQTGKAVPTPIVLLDVPGDAYWRRWDTFMHDTVLADGLVSPEDLGLYLITDDVAVARDAIVGFYRNYHSIRWVGSRLVIRLRAEPTDDELADLNERFARLCVKGGIERRGPMGPEEADGDHVDLPRLVMRYDPYRAASLRSVIDAVNELPSAPPLGADGGADHDPAGLAPTD